MTKRKGLAHGRKLQQVVLFSIRAAPVNIIREVGVRKDPFGTIRNVLNAAFVIFFVQKAAYNKAKTDFSKRIWIIVKVAVFARMNAGQER